MPVHLLHIREQLLPGLMELQYSFAQTKEVFAASVLNESAAIEQPPLPTKELIVLGLAAIIAKNPTVTRRFWSF